MKKENRGKRMSVRATVTVLLTAAVLMMSLTAAAGAVLYSRLSVYAKQYRFYLEQQDLLQTLADYNATAEEYRRQGVFAFAKTETDGCNGYEEVVSAADIAAYVSENADYNDYWYYNKLSPDEQLLYKAYEYAADNRMYCVFVDNNAVDSSADYVRAARCLTLDSAVIVQNLAFGAGGAATSDKIEVVYEDENYGDITVEKKGYRSTVMWSYAGNSQEKIDESVKAARAYVDAAPQFPTQLELAEHLYKTLCSDITYETDYFTQEDGLYDTLVKHRSQCDGFSNALALIYRIAGIECAEKTTYDHTWLSFCADGVWYNADPTCDCHYEDTQRAEGVYYGFGFSDEYTRAKFDYDYIAPVCTEDLLYKNIKSAAVGEDAENIDKLMASVSEHGGEYGFIKVSKKDYAQVYDGIMQRSDRIGDRVPTKIFYIQAWEYRSCYVIALFDTELWH